MSNEDKIMVGRWLTNRDPDAFKDIVNKYANMVYSVSKRILRNDADAEDAMQESFLVLAKGNTRHVKSLGPWLHTVATHRALDRVRSSAALRKVELQYAERVVQSETPDWDDLQGFIDEAISALPEHHREVIIGHFLQQKTHQKIAAELGLSRQTVTYRQKKAIDRIRRTLRKNGIVVSAAFLSNVLTSAKSGAAASTLVIEIHKLALTPAQYTPSTILTPLLNLSKPALLKAAVVLMLAAGAMYAGFSQTTDTRDTQSTNDSPKAKLTDAISTVATAILPSAVEAVQIPTSDVSGRVYDVASNEGLESIVVRLDRPDAVPTELQETQTDVDGYYAFVNLEPGLYTLAVGGTDVYVTSEDGFVSRDVSIEDSGELYEENFPLTAASVLEGLITAGPEPIRNSSISINNYFDNDNIEPFQVETNEKGRYRITGLDDFEGILRASRTRDDGTSQGALQTQSEATTISAGTITTADFKFAGGGASIEGNVYYIDETQPLVASVGTYFITDSGDALALNGTYSQTDENGHYRIDNLPQGVISLQVHAKGKYSGTITNEATLREGETTNHNIVFGDSVLHCRLHNVPVDSKHVMVYVESGIQRPKKKRTTLDFANAVGEAVSWSHVNFTADEPGAKLENLKPGEYTVFASSLPTKWNVADMVAMGWDEFLSRVILTRVYVTVESYSQDIDLDLDFAIVEAWKEPTLSGSVSP